MGPLATQPNPGLSWGLIGVPLKKYKYLKVKLNKLAITKQQPVLTVPEKYVFSQPNNAQANKISYLKHILNVHTLSGEAPGD